MINLFFMELWNPHLIMLFDATFACGFHLYVFCLIIQLFYNDDLIMFTVKSDSTLLFCIKKIV
jgi:hypothetical protein